MGLNNNDTKKKIDESQVLICTALNRKWPNLSENILFLGEWCKKYDESEIWNNLSYSIFTYHWEDRKKRESDYVYLAKLYEECLIDIALFLNKYHNTNHSILFWRIVIGPWFIFYINSLYDRFEMLRLVFATGTIFNCSELKCDAETSVAFDFDSFCNLMADDNWNYDIYQRVLNYFIEIGIYEKQIIDIGRRKSSLKLHKILKKKSKRDKVISIFDSIFYRFTKANKIIFFNSYFPTLSLVKLHRLLKLNISFYSNIFQYDSTCEFDLATRGFKFNSPTNDTFKSFVLSNILIDLPPIHLELFSDIYNKSKAIVNVPKYIVSAGSWANNDIFKIWTARLVDLKKSKLLVLDHGGSFYHADNIFDHESKISEIYVSWIKPHRNNQIQLPPNKYTGKLFNYKPGSKLLIIGTEENRYAYKSSSTPISSLSLLGIELMIKIIQTLDGKIKNHVFVRPYNNPDGWLSEKRIKDKIPELRFLSGIPFGKIFHNTKLIICTQPQTSYTECLLTGLPTILVFEKKLYDFVPLIMDLVNEMYECKMIFYDAEEASSHINLIWEDPNRWWQTKEVQKCVEKFFIEAVQYRKDGLMVWYNYFSKLLN
jgi:putative transferase (TIGR04331 family)